MLPDSQTKSRLKAEYANRVVVVGDILRRRDPVWLIEMGAPRDEYEPEARMVVARSRNIASQCDAIRVVTGVFEGQFGSTSLDAEALQLAAGDISKML